LQSGFINSFPFDPVGLNSSKHAVNEVKNGRLAMVSETRGVRCRGWCERNDDTVDKSVVNQHG
jgi:hypothetical protein